jgi:8-oxo-dGTP diphosphatase
MASEFSAGGVVFNAARDVVVIVPTRRAADGSRVLALPKGHPDGSESPAQAALREVREEAGVEAELVESLGEVRYWYQRGGRRIAKAVEFFLLRYVSGDVADHDHEVEHARWIPAEEAAETLTYDGEREMVRKALSRWGLGQ